MPKRKSNLNQALKRAAKKPQRKEPVWKGPEVDGITQSLLSKFLVCKERFRLYVVEGLTEQDQFNHALEYGNMWHFCEEALAADVNHLAGNLLEWGWQPNLERCAKQLCKRYPLQQEQVAKWYNVCLLQFPIYVKYWKNDSDEKKRTPLLQEQTFCVPYELPSGRVVKLKGKWDSVDLIGKGKNAKIWLQENKTKGDIKEEQLRRQLTFDLQTMFYLVALQRTQESCLSDRVPNWLDTLDASTNASIAGVRYNVVRRPLAGGRGSIRPHKATKTKPAETLESYYRRLAGIIESEPEYYFMHWKVAISQEDIDRFKREFLDPCLESLCDWWQWIRVTKRRGPFSQGNGFLSSPHGNKNSLHYRLPYGIYSPLAEGRTTELDEYLISGSTVGLRRINNLFPEL